MTSIKNSTANAICKWLYKGINEGGRADGPDEGRMADTVAQPIILHALLLCSCPAVPTNAPPSPPRAYGSLIRQRAVPYVYMYVYVYVCFTRHILSLCVNVLYSFCCTVFVIFDCEQLTISSRSRTVAVLEQLVLAVVIIVRCYNKMWGL